MQKLAAMQAKSEDNATTLGGWLTCSRTLFAWRHVTMRMHASRLSLHENLTRHHCTSMAATFKAWSILCIITKNWKRIFARVSQRVSQGLTRRCLTQWQLYAHNPKPQTSKPDPLLPHSRSALITRARTSASSIISTLHSNVCRCSLHAWAAAAAPRAAARARARQRDKTPLQFAFHGRLQVDS